MLTRKQYFAVDSALPAYHSSVGGLQVKQGKAGSGGEKLGGSQSACLFPPPPSSNRRLYLLLHLAQIIFPPPPSSNRKLYLLLHLAKTANHISSST